MTASSTVDERASARSSLISAGWDDLLAALAPLWVGGIALLCLVPGYLMAPVLTALAPRAGVWSQYLALGVLFPAVVAAIVLGERAGHHLPRPLHIVLAAIPIVAVAIVAGPAHSAMAIGLALAQTAVCLGIASRYARVTAALVLALLVTGFIAWGVVLEVRTWPILVEVMPPSLPLFGAVVTALIACCWWGFGARRVNAGVWGRAEIVIGVVCGVALVLLAFRTDGLFTTDRLGADGTFYHWGALVAPAESVRQGGWPLWDVPSPYGFLTTLTLAAFPAATAWQSLYVLNAAASALLAIGFFLAIRAVRPGIPGSLLALAATAASVFLVSVWPPDLTPEHYFPMAGAFRYGWSYVLVGMLLLERSVAPGSRRQRVVLAAGCLSWLGSMLWSAESAFIGSAIWLPAFALIVLRDTVVVAAERNWRGALTWLAIPPLLLAAALGAIFAIYRLVLGHGPDLVAYVETVVTFSGTSVGALTGMFEGVGPNRTIAVLLFGYLLLIMSASSVAMSRQGWRDVPALTGLALGLWGLASYAVGLPVPFAIFRLLPYTLLALAVVLAIFAPRPGEQTGLAWVTTMRAGTIPLLAAVLATAYSNPGAFQFYAEAIRNEGFRGRDITVGLPLVEPSLQDLMQQAGVASSDPIYYAGGLYGDMMPRWTPAGEQAPVAVSEQWLAGPLSTMVTRPEDRKRAFTQRRAARQDRGGWLIERQQKDALVYAIGPWFFAQLHTSHVPAKIAANGDWQLVWYEPRDVWRASFGERAPPAGEPSLPRDLAVNGKPLAASVFPAVWGYFGPEWTEATGPKAWRCAAGRGTVSLFVPSPRRAALAFALSPGASGVRVAVNDKPAEAPEQSPGGRVVAPLSLAAGWNTVAIEVGDSSGATQDAAATADHCARDNPESRQLRVRAVDFQFGETQMPR